MKHYLLVSLLVFATGNLLAQGLATKVPSEETQNQSVIAEDPVEASESYSPSLGLAAEFLSSVGLTYKRPVNKSAVVWVTGSYGFGKFLWEDRLNSGLSKGALTAKQKRSFQLAAGIDQHLSFFGVKRSYFVIGAGIGINRSDIEATYYKSMCAFICGYDPSSGIQRQERDIYGFFLSRVGVLKKDGDFFGAKADIGIYWTPYIARWDNEYRFKTPHSGHTDYSYEDRRSMQIEATFHL